MALPGSPAAKQQRTRLPPRATNAPAWRSFPGTAYLDQTPAFDPAEPDRVPDFEFDQSLPDDFDA